MKNALILYYNFKESLENLFNYIILNLQDNLINNENEINNVFSLLRPTLIEIMNKINSIKSKLTNLERSIFIATYLADNSTNPLRKDYLDTINEFYKEIKSTILYKNIVNIKNEISIDFDDSKEDNSEYPVLNNELLYFGILIIYVILPTLHEIMKNWQKKQLINISSLINELEETYLEDIKINRVINSESNFFLNSFFQIDENNEKRQKL
ncbi:hypothetical protein BCR32DRAFT_136920 [Anaeromyces robustus]|uniref:Uncharacterized protein n=1 Tax=Anaeromyces robustus TaxID=1754192 RepID=A0A1Y1XPL3_9FUNG|nr:hypothetical protein BCR32DRAFT_136920 [Anaeromyces robustus]|eukprot:ORX87683.1 hypothetical protein BCR32DRAFT_136920 [Anaeromyces robustus]